MSLDEVNSKIYSTFKNFCQKQIKYIIGGTILKKTVYTWQG